jgi:glycosyltransferase involved in cell wall biosynthesis
MGIEGRRVLFISYNGMLDPLGQSQVLPYLRELGKRGVRFTLLSFERPVAFADRHSAPLVELRNKLAAAGIDWHYLRYHQTPSLPATMFDVINGIHLGQRLIKDKRIELVHARSHIPATMALALKRQFGVKLIFDVRGILADEYVDAGHWKKGSVPYRLTKTMERRAFAAADGIVTLTKRIWPIIKQWDGLRSRQDVIHEVVPCCADFEHFKFSSSDRARRRQELGISGRFVMVYSGSIDGWYLTEEMADFFAVVSKQRPGAHLLWLTPTKHDRLRSLMTKRGLASSDYTVRAATLAEVPSYLSASDAGLAFIRSCLSKLASSPTKYAEYLGCGLPLVINEGIGDADELVTSEHAGVLVKLFNEVEYGNALTAIEPFVRDAEGTRTRMREVARRLFDLRVVGVERYTRLYESVLQA